MCVFNCKEEFSSWNEEQKGIWKHPKTRCKKWWTSAPKDQLQNMVVCLLDETHMPRWQIKAHTRASYWSQTCHFVCATALNVVFEIYRLNYQQTLQLPTLSSCPSDLSTARQSSPNKSEQKCFWHKLQLVLYLGKVVPRSILLGL